MCTFINVNLFWMTPFLENEKACNEYDYTSSAQTDAEITIRQPPTKRLKKKRTFEEYIDGNLINAPKCKNVTHVIL